MIICHCKAVSECVIEKLLAEGKTIQEIVELTKITTDCGGCIDVVYRKYIERDIKNDY
jgi:bacterioferritin-associated ferredoxin